MKALVGAFNQEKALVGAFSVTVKPQSSRRFVWSSTRECGGCQLCRFRCHTQFASPRCASICEAFCLRWQRRTLSNSELQHSCKLGTCKFPGRPSLAMQIRSQGYMVLRQQPAAGILMGSPDPHTGRAGQHFGGGFIKIGFFPIIIRSCEGWTLDNIFQLNSDAWRGLNTPSIENCQVDYIWWLCYLYLR